MIIFQHLLLSTCQSCHMFSFDSQKRKNKNKENFVAHSGKLHLKLSLCHSCSSLIFSKIVLWYRFFSKSHTFQQISRGTVSVLWLCSEWLPIDKTLDLYLDNDRWGIHHWPSHVRAKRGEEKQILKATMSLYHLCLHRRRTTVSAFSAETLCKFQHQKRAVRSTNLNCVWCFCCTFLVISSTQKIMLLFVVFIFILPTEYNLPTPKMSAKVKSDTAAETSVVCTAINK